MSQEPKNIKVVGVGGGGGNIVRLLVANPTPGVSCLICDPDERAAYKCQGRATHLEMGRSVRIPWPSGEFKIESGRLRAECPWFLRELKYHVKGADLVIMTVGMGGVTGTGGSPVIARVVKEMGIPLLAVVNTPYSFEGVRRSQDAAKGIQDLKPYADNILTVPSDFALRCVDGHTPISRAFAVIDEIMVQAIAGLTNLINGLNEMNVSFADVCRILRIPGQSTVAFGSGTRPEHPALDAAEKAIANTVHPVDLARTRGAVVAFSGDPDIGLGEYAEAVDFITSKLGQNADLLFGISNHSGAVRRRVNLTLVITGTRRVETPRVLQLVKELLDGETEE